MSSSFAAYFSHSWSHHDLPVNLMLWQHISRHCHLLIDQPRPSSESLNPYFISRMESIIRHADVMMCCLPAIPAEKRSLRKQNAVGDWRYTACSPYILFELRLAERLDLPRFVLYDRDSRFVKPTHLPPHVRYVQRSFTELKALISAGKEDSQLLMEIDDWLRWVEANRTSAPWTTPTRSACLVAPDSPLGKCQPILNEAMDAGGFEPPEMLTSLFHTDAELYQVLRSLGLLVVDISHPSLLPLYHAAHSLMVPTIRIDASRTSPGHLEDTELPLLLRGHPAGYQLDVLQHAPYASEETFYTRVFDRATAASQAAQQIIGTNIGARLLHERTYPPGRHFVFISHNEKLHDRELVDLVVEELKNKGLKCWEYAVENRSGELWRRNMEEALSKTTLMVALLSPSYEQSNGCVEEWKYAREHEIPIRPFLIRGRTSPNVDLRGDAIAHQPLYDSIPIMQRAELVVSCVVLSIRNGNRPVEDVNDSGTAT